MVRSSYSIHRIMEGGQQSMAMPTHIVAVGGFVINEQGKVLLVKTQHEGWVYPGGQVENGENLLEALSREIKEESGIDAVPVQLVGIYSNTSAYKWHDGVTDVPTKVMMDFICQPLGGELSTSDETSDSRWVPRDQVLELITAPAIRTRYQAYLDFEGKVHYMDYATKPHFDLKLATKV